MFFDNYKDHPKRYAYTFWPEISNFQQEREKVIKLASRLLGEIKSYVEQQGGHFLVLIADEEHRNQQFWIELTDLLDQELPELDFDWGWSKQTIKRLVTDLKIDHISIHHPDENIETMYIPNDGHTSAVAFSILAEKIIAWMEHENHMAP